MSNPASPQVLQRIRAEYLEMPGLMLKPEQVQRLCGVDDSMCQLALQTLVESGFLCMRPNGTYGRFSSPDISHARPATASLDPSASAVRRPHAS